MAGLDEELDSVDSLLTICVNFCVNNLEATLADKDAVGFWHLKPDVTLPVNVCENLLKAFVVNDFEINDGVLNIFSDTERTRLCRARVKDSLITDEGVAALTRHNLVELDLSNCPFITSDVVSTIDENCRSLRALYVNDWSDFIRHFHRDHHVFRNVDLRILIARNLSARHCPIALVERYAQCLIQSFSDLHVLDVSSASVNVADWPYLQTLKCLTSLILYDCTIVDMEEAVNSLIEIKSLR